ncbi:hypothetical protein E2C01_025951 [Portunus trituberculatus]|uniref:Uncharacterized protein n=1 Tax=Portunus trituberculatus TaxID=210409 RepID=A0A5B7EHD5_PORTR|nr:hypothetical protein [Portunus trituberculatus]
MRKGQQQLNFFRRQAASFRNLEEDGEASTYTNQETCWWRQRLTTIEVTKRDSILFLIGIRVDIVALASTLKTHHLLGQDVAKV